jgi:hypothetical protein
MEDALRDLDALMMNAKEMVSPTKPVLSRFTDEDVTISRSR